MIYATQDGDDDFIARDADIRKFATEAEAAEWLLRPYRGAGWKMETASIEPGRFGDCWITTTNRPKIGDAMLAPFSYTQLHIQRPGEHPGGRQYWITPRVDVLVVARIEADPEGEIQ